MFNSNDGFTLLELILALAIAGILLSLALPSWKNFQQHLHAKIITTRLIDSLSYARIEALLHNEPVQLLPLNNNFQNGWEIILNNSVLKIYPPSTVSIRTTQLSRKNSITFQSNGMSEGNNGNFQINNEYKITLNRGGRISVTHTQAPTPQMEHSESRATLLRNKNYD